MNQVLQRTTVGGIALEMKALFVVRGGGITRYYPDIFTAIGEFKSRAVKAGKRKAREAGK